MNSEELLRRFPCHRKRLVASLSRLVGPFEAEDLAQETLLRALAGVANFRGEAGLGTWLHRIGVNLAHDLLRRRNASPILPAEHDLETTEPTDLVYLGEGLEQRQMSHCVQELLKQLPAQQRQMLVEADLLDCSTPQIARNAGISIGNAKIRLYRARRAMQVALESQCNIHHQAPGILCCTPKTEC